MMHMGRSGMTSIQELIFRSNRFIDVGERKVVIATRDYGRGKPRFIINLPTTRNDIWQYLWENKITIRVYIEIPEKELERVLEQGQVKAKRNERLENSNMYA